MLSDILAEGTLLWDPTSNQGSPPNADIFLVPEDAVEISIDLSYLLDNLQTSTPSPFLLSGKTVYFTCLSCTLLLLFLLTCLVGFSFSICMQSRRPEVLLVQEEGRKKDAKTKETGQV
jgi:hypothetical protein